MKNLIAEKNMWDTAEQVCGNKRVNMVSQNKMVE